jgi:hypothetical protein
MLANSAATRWDGVSDARSKSEVLSGFTLVPFYMRCHDLFMGQQSSH